MALTRSLRPLSTLSSRIPSGLPVVSSMNLLSKAQTVKATCGSVRHFSSDQGELDDDENMKMTKEELTIHAEMLRNYYLDIPGKQNVFVIQPFIRGVDRHKDLMMEESISLVKTLEWLVIDSIAVGLRSFQKPLVYGSGSLERIKSKLDELPYVKVIFISTYKLKPLQIMNLENYFGLPVLDRYNLVLQIFDRHARTADARLQIDLAQIPYLKAKLRDDLLVENRMKHDKKRLGSEHFDTLSRNLNKRERILKSKLNHLVESRKILRQGRIRLKIPSVAVVGYTNCGKTSLIKALTDAKNLQPKDKLFATLDVTVHEGVLPSQLRTLFVDTVGFISDIPTSLIASFSATLEDALLADVILHVRDVSHPDAESQNREVMATLEKLSMTKEQKENMIVVGNKIDKIDTSKWDMFQNCNYLPISVTEGFGLSLLQQKLEAVLTKVTGRKPVTIRCKTGGVEFEWLYQNVDVSVVETDPKDANYSLVTAIMLDMQLEKFKKAMGLRRVKSK